MLDVIEGFFRFYKHIVDIDFHSVAHRAGNEPSYSGLARKKLGLGSARELNEPSLSLNLGLINLGLGSGSALARLWLDSKKLGSGRRDPSIAGTRLPPTVSDRQDLVFTDAIPT